MYITLVGIIYNTSTINKRFTGPNNFEAHLVSVKYHHPKKTVKAMIFLCCWQLFFRFEIQHVAVSDRNAGDAPTQDRAGFPSRTGF